MLALAHRMADEAGEILRRYFRVEMTVDSKADASPVTKADREVETMLRSHIEAAYPQHGIIGEEFGNVRPEAELQWILDPIDGTRAFIAGETTFTTLIALAKKGTPILGVINQPITNERWVGVTGQPTLLNGKPVSVRNCGSLSQATVATTGMQYFTAGQAAIFDRLKSKCGNVKFGGDAYLYASLASGRVDLVVEAGLKPYDFCTHASVIEGAGGIITDWNGQPLTLHSDGRVIAAGTKELHQQALTVLQAAA